MDIYKNKHLKTFVNYPLFLWCFRLTSRTSRMCMARSTGNLCLRPSHPTPVATTRGSWWRWSASRDLVRSWLEGPWSVEGFWPFPSTNMTFELDVQCSKGKHFIIFAVVNIKIMFYNYLVFLLCIHCLSLCLHG